MSDKFENKLLGFINANDLFEKIDRVLLAVSGGADSVAMTHVLCRLRQAGRLHCDFVVAHINHGLRGGDSDGDEVFVKAMARQLEMPVVAVSVPVNQYVKENRVSIETAGRILRLKALARIMQQNGCQCVVTAHHKDDLAETIIHRLMRGTGFRGLCGIWPVSEVYEAEFVRPMLGVLRHEIIQYCIDNNLTWRDDASNRDIHFTRNRIRHRLLPALNNDAVIEQLSELSYKSRRFLLRTEKHAQAIFAEGKLDGAKKEFLLEQDILQNCPPWVFYETMRLVLIELGVGLRRFKKEHFNAIRKLFNEKKAKGQYPGGVDVFIDKNVVRIRRKDELDTLPQESVVLQTGQTIQFGPWKISCRLLKRGEADIEQFLKTKDAFVEWFDADKITGPIEIRCRKEGDRFWPIGAKGQKKIGRFLMDAGLDTTTKQNAFIISDDKNILWLAPIRMSELAKVTEAKNDIMEIRITPMGSLDV